MNMAGCLQINLQIIKKSMSISLQTYEKRGGSATLQIALAPGKQHIMMFAKKTLVLCEPTNLNLERKITESFLEIVSETMATSYQPFVTEKFLYSVVTRGLFVAYAQPGWHEHLERYYGFRKYDKIFDYGFDEIQNPVERLVDLMSMISKFSVLSRDDWRDLYEMEIDTIEYNHDHYFRKKYIKQFEQVS